MPSTKLHELLNLPTVHELALQRVGSICASLVDHPSPVGTAFDQWLSADEGAQNRYSPFGLIQDALLRFSSQIPPPPLAPYQAIPPAPEVVGKVLPTTLQLHTAYLLRSLLIEAP